jgi:uncharacterized protein YidB (DUF937 family)
MGLFDDALKKSVPNGDIATPIAVVAGALILGKLFGGLHMPGSPAAAPAAPTPVPAPTAAPGGGVLSGLNDLIGKLSAGGHSGAVNSWVGSGANQPIAPGPLGNALGQQTLQDLAAKSGLSQEELLQQLALVLPNLVNHLTPNGTLPTQQQLGG